MLCGNDVSARQDSEQGRQDSPLLERGGEPARGRQAAHRTAHGITSWRDQQQPGRGGAAFDVSRVTDNQLTNGR